MALKPSLKLVRELALKNESCFRKVDAEIPLMIHPMYASDLKRGVISELEQLMNRSYSKRLNGVPVYYEKVQLLSQKGWIFGAEPYIHIPLRATFYVFSPELGVTLKGVVKKASLNHVGCLVHGLFNVSVLRSQSNDIEQWCGDMCKEGDEIELIVTSLDVTGYVPHILAQIVPESIPDHSEEKVTTSITAKFKEQQNRRIVFNDEDSGISTTDSTESPEHNEKIKKKKNKRGTSVSATSDSTVESHDGESKNHLHNVKSAIKDEENQNRGVSLKSKFLVVTRNEESVKSKNGKSQAMGEVSIKAEIVSDSEEKQLKTKKKDRKGSKKDEGSLKSKNEKSQAIGEVNIKTEFTSDSEEKQLKTKKKDRKGNKKDFSNVDDFSGNFRTGLDVHESKNVTSDTCKKEDGYQERKKKKKDKDKEKTVDSDGVLVKCSVDNVSDFTKLIEPQENLVEKGKKKKKRKSSEVGALDLLDDSSNSYVKTLAKPMEGSKAEKTKKSGKRKKSSESGVLESLESSDKLKASNSVVDGGLNSNSCIKFEESMVNDDIFRESLSEAHNSHMSVDITSKKKKKKSSEKRVDLDSLDETNQNPEKFCVKEKKEKSSGKKSSKDKKKHSGNTNTSTPNSTKSFWDSKYEDFDDLPFF